MDSYDFAPLLASLALLLNEYSEQYRLKTLENWNVDFIDKNELAMHGFYFWEPPDSVRCAFCHVIIRKWEPCDDILISHYEVSPQCPLLNLRASKNVPLKPEELDRVLLSASTAFCTGCDDTVVRIDRPGQTTEVHISISTEYIKMDMPHSCYLPKYNDCFLRFRTFQFCGWNSKKTPQELCNAGFFNTKIGDKVTCFCCGGSVSGWKADDCPWEVHAYRFSYCKFLKKAKGKELIVRAKEKFVRNQMNTTNQEAGPSSSNTSTSGPLPGSSSMLSEKASEDSEATDKPE